MNRMAVEFRRIRSRLHRTASSACLLVIAFAMSLGVSSAALATEIALPGGSYYTVWGHEARVNSQAIVSFTAYSSWMDVWENSGYTMLLNGGPVRCSRSRVFGDNWELLYSIQAAGSPFPISTYNTWYFDTRTFSTVTDGYPIRGFYQVTSVLDNGVCGYGGGVGWEKPGQFTAWDRWATST